MSKYSEMSPSELMDAAEQELEVIGGWDNFIKRIRGESITDVGKKVYARTRLYGREVEFPTPMAYAASLRFILGLSEIPLPRCRCGYCGAEKLLYLAEQGGTVCTDCGGFFHGEPKWFATL